MTKNRLKDLLKSGGHIDEIFNFIPGQECEIFKEKDFYPGCHIIYIPDVVLNEIPLGVSVRDEKIEEIIASCYTGDDFIEDCGGNKRMAERLFQYCDWQHPSSALYEIAEDVIVCRELTRTEHMYTVRQSTQISGQTGLIGHFEWEEQPFGSFIDYRKDLKTQEFISAFDAVAEYLQNGSYNDDIDIQDTIHCGSVLKDRTAVQRYAAANRRFGEDVECGIRIDTDNYTFLLRVNPLSGGGDLFCYKRDWLDSHLEKASRGIRFINSTYKELFRIPDGGRIKIRTTDGEELERTCRYIDDYHVEIGRNLYHICEFAERMETAHNTVSEMSV